MKFYASVFAFLLFQTIFSQTLLLPDIMKGDEFIGHQPENHRWSIDGSTVYFDWNPKNEKGNSTFFWKKGMKLPELLQKDISFTEENFENQRQFNEVYYTQNGNLFSYDKKAKTHKKVIVSSGRISNVQRSENPKLIFFQQNNNIFQLNLTDFSMIQLTNFKQGKESEKKEKENFLSNQQKELFQFINDQEAQKEWNKSKSESEEKAFPKEFFYDKVSMEQLTPSPNGKFVTFRQSDYPTSNPTKVEQFITADGSIISARPSGTEPKMKCYVEVIASDEKIAQSHLDALRGPLKKLLSRD